MCSMGVFLGVWLLSFMKLISICSGVLDSSRMRSVSVVILSGMRLRMTIFNGRMSCVWAEDYLLLHEGEPQDTNNYKYVNGKANGWMYVLPQEFIEGDPRLVITYDIVNGSKIVETNNLTYNLMGTAAWPLGQTLRYYITVNIADREDLTVHTVCINDWEDAGNTQGGSEELLY